MWIAPHFIIEFATMVRFDRFAKMKYNFQYHIGLIGRFDRSRFLAPTRCLHFANGSPINGWGSFVVRQFKPVLLSDSQQVYYCRFVYIIHSRNTTTTTTANNTNTISILVSKCFTNVPSALITESIKTDGQVWTKRRERKKKTRWR